MLERFHMRGVSDGKPRRSDRSRRGAPQSTQIELRISDGRLQRRARHGLQEPALLELEALRLQVSLHRERVAVVVEPPVAQLRRKMHGVAACLLETLSLLLFQKLPFQALLHLKLVEAPGVRRRQVMAGAGPHLPEIEVQRILLLLELERAAMCCHASLICCRHRQRKNQDEKRGEAKGRAAHVTWDCVRPAGFRPLATAHRLDGGCASAVPTQQLRPGTFARGAFPMDIISPWFNLGYIIPHRYTDMDAYQFYRVAPEGMMLVTTGLDLQGHSLEAVERELPAFWAAVDLFAKRKVDRIALSGVPVASMLGRQRMRQLLADAQSRSGVPCDTDLEAHIAALRHFGARRVALATRWGEPTNTALTRYLAEAEIEVAGIAARATSFGVSRNSNPADDHLLALELGRNALTEFPAAQALLMPGGLWHAMHAVPMLEAEFGKPVLLNILSTTRAALVQAGERIVKRPDPKWGKVLQAIE
jgi:maleate cis-trans isomerase